MKKSIFLVFLMVVLVASLAACAPVKSDTGADASEAYRVALILPGRADDVSWNQAAFEGMKWAVDNVGFPVELKVVEQVYDVADIEPALRDFAQQGYDLVVGHGFQFQEPIIKVAPEFPDTAFALGTGFKLAPNVGVYDVRLEQGGYVMGILAGMMTKSDVLGVTGGVDVSEIHRGHAGFMVGAKAVNPDVKVINTFIGDFNDLSGAKEAALNHVSAGADILWQSGDGIGIAVMGACAEKNVFCMGNNANQNSLAPKNALASVVYAWGPVYSQMMKEDKEGTFGNKQYWIDFSNDGIEIVWNDALKSQVPADAIAKIEQAKKDFAKDAIDLGDLDNTKLE
jgi:basic membrane protein A and related proteins